jgi:cytochrome c-type biogenesis protein CcmE
MDDRFILISCSLFAALGLFALYIISDLVVLPDSDLATLTLREGQVRMTGSVEDLHITQGRTSFRLTDSCSVSVVHFAPLVLRDGDRVKVLGDLRVSGNRSEIVADEIICISGD